MSLNWERYRLDGSSVAYLYPSPSQQQWFQFDVNPSLNIPTYWDLEIYRCSRIVGTMCISYLAYKNKAQALDAAEAFVKKQNTLIGRLGNR